MCFLVEQINLSPPEISVLTKLNDIAANNNREFHQEWLSENPGQVFTNYHVVEVPDDVIQGKLVFSSILFFLLLIF